MTFRVTRIDHDKKYVYCVVESIKLMSTKRGGISIAPRQFAVSVYTNSQVDERWINHVGINVGTSWKDVTSNVSLSGISSYPCTDSETRLGFVNNDGTGRIQVSTRSEGTTSSTNSGDVPLTNAVYFNNNVVYDIYLNGTKVDNILYLNDTVVG